MTTSSDELTATNNASDSVFKEPISADVPRRQFDRKVIESYDSTQERIRNISSRVTRIEAIFESLSKDLRRMEDLQREMSMALETTATTMRNIGSKLSVHSDMEEYQWTLVNKAHETLAQIGVVLNDHLKQAEGLITRINWIERLMWALWGVIGAATAALIPIVLKGIGL